MKRILLGSCVLLMSVLTVKAQMVGTDAYIKGTSVEIGIDGSGGFEGVDTTLSPLVPGLHMRSGTQYFGFVANPQLNSWAGSAYDGDFFTPGSPENGWGFEIGINGISGNNNCAIGSDDIHGALTSWQYVGSTYSIIWDGDDTAGTNLHFRINYSLDESDLFFITAITVKNNTSSLIPDLYYYRNFDPDNNETIFGTYNTLNTIVSQPDSGGLAMVSASQTAAWTSYIALVAIDTNFRASYGGFANRDASNLYNGVGFTQTVGVPNNADEAIAIAYRINNLAPGDSTTFKFCIVFDSASRACAINALSIAFTPPVGVTAITPPFLISGGSPSGGIYSGTGVIGGNTFDPSTSGPGDFPVSYTLTDSTGCHTSVISTIHVDLTTGMQEHTNQNLITVYPNPFNTTTTFKIPQDIRLSGASLHIFNVVGKEVITLENINSHDILIDRKDLASGSYFYKLINNSEIISQDKLIIK